MTHATSATCLAAILAMASPMAAGPKTSGPKTYKNAEFGIRLQVPGDDLLCQSPKDEHDHGFGLVLGGGSPADCHEGVRHRSIWLFAFSNVLDDTKHLPGLLKMGCDAAGGRCEPTPVVLQIPGLPSATGRVDLPDGWIVVVLATKAGVPDRFDPSEPSVNYLFSLWTTKEYLDQDLGAFRTVLQSVRLSGAPSQ